MNDPKRLLADPNAGAFQRELLASFDDERPSADAKKRMLAALGISAVAGGIAASSGAGGAGAAASIAPKALGASIAVKWALFSILLVGGAASVALYARLSVPTESAAQTQAPLASPNHRDAVDAPVVTAPLSTTRSLVDNANATKTANAAALPQHATRIATSSSASTLGAELASMDRARAALDSGDASAALARIDEYETRYKNGAFTQEAEALRVQALLGEGDRAGAERVGKRFLARYPESPHADRVRRLLGNLK